MGAWTTTQSVRTEVALGILAELLRLCEGDIDQERQGPAPDQATLARLDEQHRTLMRERETLWAPSDAETAIAADRVIAMYGPVLRERSEAG